MVLILPDDSWHGTFHTKIYILEELEDKFDGNVIKPVLTINI